MVPEASRLSYKQLLRIVTFLDADSSGEKYLAKKFVGSITPPERSVISRVDSYKKHSARYNRALHEVRLQMIKRSVEGIKTQDAERLIEKLDD
jgi:hypothetical protein